MKGKIGTVDIKSRFTKFVKKSTRWRVRVGRKLFNLFDPSLIEINFGVRK